MANWRKGFESQIEELSLDALAVEGQVPTWLDGAFISTGPALFEINGKKVKHWFDGLASLKGFYLHQGQVDFKSQYVRSDEYLRDVDGSLKHDSPYDNGNVNVFQLGKEGVALTESAMDNRFNLADLSTQGHPDYKGNIELNMELAHALKDPCSDKWINVGLTFGPKTTYTIFSIDGETKQRDVIATYESDITFYIHSFSLTEHYVILFQTPLTLDVSKMMQGDVGFDQMLKYESTNPTQLIVISRASGDAKTYATKPFMCFHQANAYERDDKLILDLGCNYDELGYNDLSFDAIEHDACEPESFLERFVIDLEKNVVTNEHLSDIHMEFPRIAAAYQGKPYQYVYLAAHNLEQGSMYGDLVKINVDTKAVKYWQADDHFCGEPIFVPNPNGVSEDDGVVLSMVYDAIRDISYLLVLDGLSFTELARVDLPIRMPYALHGAWFVL